MERRNSEGARLEPVPQAPRRGVPLRMQASDGVALGGQMWRHAAPSRNRPVVVIAPATSVHSRYYGRFADYLFEQGFDVLTFDYRGIGLSRPPSLRGFRADWVDWGEKDLEAALRHAEAACPGQPLDVVGHSIGGFAIGIAPSGARIRRIVTVGAQYAHWRDYDRALRGRMVLKWHVVMPALTALCGYFPARRLGWMEDTPAGVVRDWSRMAARFEDTVRQGQFVAGAREADLLVQRFARVTAPMLAIGLGDDPHGTPEALGRLLAYFTASRWRHWRVMPSDIGADDIGHFAFFHARFRDTLWPLALAWLTVGDLPGGAPGRLLAQAPREMPRPVQC